MAEVEVPPLVGVKTLADVAVPPSRDTPESSRRETLVVDKPTIGFEEREKGGSSDFGPVITTGEPSHIDSGSKRGSYLTGFRQPTVFRRLMGHMSHSAFSTIQNDQGSRHQHHNDHQLQLPITRPVPTTPGQHQEA